MTRSGSSSSAPMRLWAAAALVWAVGAAALQWSDIDDARHMLAIDLGERPALDAEERALLDRDCDALPSTLQRARCELDQGEARRAIELWEAATAELAERRAEAWQTLAFALAVILLPPAALLSAGRLVGRAARGDDKAGSDS